MGNRRRKSTEWRMEPKVNQTEGAQGTLFSGGPHRYPRGYTPERKVEVRKAINVIGPAVHGVGDREKARVEREYGGRARVWDTVARSTMPMSDLQGENVRIHSMHSDLIPHRPHMAGAGGVYLGRQGVGGGWPHHQIDVREENADSSVVLHELGHAVSAIRGTGAYSTPAERGREEGRADSYATTHFRDRRGRPEVSSFYPPSEDQITDHIGERRPMAFHNAYVAARGDQLPKGSTGDLISQLSDEQDQWRHDNPMLPGMPTRSRYSEGMPPHYELPYTYERRKRSEAGRNR